MNYILEGAYDSFMESSKQQQNEMDRYIQECLILSRPSNSSIKEIESLNEAVGQSIKDGFNKFIEFIKKVWAKFIEKFNNLVASNKTYLDKYKDIILKNKPLEATYTMRNYANGIKNMTNTSVPIFNYASLKERLVDKVTFEKSVCQNISDPAFNEKAEFVDYLKDAFRGSLEDKEFKSTELNMTDIYNYCYNYKEMKDRIEKDQKTIEKAALDAAKVIDSIEIKEKNAKTAQTNNSADKANDTSSARTVNAEVLDKDGNKTGNTSATIESQIAYSAIYGQYITEDVARKVADGAKPEGSNPTSTAGANTTAAASNQNITAGTKAATADETKEAVGEEIKEAKDRIQNYLDVAKIVLTCKLTVAEEIYKGYMQIIRAHVNDYISGNKENKVQQSATNYKELSDEQKKAVDELGGAEKVASMSSDEIRSAAEGLGFNSSRIDVALGAWGKLGGSNKK